MRFLLEVTKGLAASPDAMVSVSYSRTADIAADIEALPIRKLAITTFRSRRDLLVGVLRFPSTAMQLRRYLVSEQIDVVYLTMESPFALVALGLVRRGLPLKVLTGIHDATSHPGDRAWLHRLQRKLVTRVSDGLVAYSSDVASHLSRQYRLPVLRTVLGMLGTDASSVHRVLPTEGPLIVGFFGRILEYKGLGVLIDAHRLVRIAGRSVVLRIVGEGDLAPYHSALATGIDIDVSNAWTPDVDVAGIVAGFDLLVLPYLEASQSGVVGLAISAGVPIVATPVGGLIEQIEETSAGLLSADMTPESVSSAIEQILTDPVLYSKLSAAGIEAAQGVHSPARAASDFISFAASVAARKEEARS